MVAQRVDVQHPAIQHGPITPRQLGTSIHLQQRRLGSGHHPAPASNASAQNLVERREARFVSAVPGAPEDLSARVHSACRRNAQDDFRLDEQRETRVLAAIPVNPQDIAVGANSGPCGVSAAGTG